MYGVVVKFGLSVWIVYCGLCVFVFVKDFKIFVVEFGVVFFVDVDEECGVVVFDVVIDDFVVFVVMINI